MLKEEFEERMGYHVTDEEFNTVNNVYEYSSLDKDEFCEKLKHDPFELAQEMCYCLQTQYSRVSFLETKNKQLEQNIDEALNALYIEAESYSDDGYRKKLLSQIKNIGGLNRYVKLVLADKLDEEELETVMSQLE